MEINLVFWYCQFVLDLVYGLHGHTSHPQDFPSPMEFMGIHLIYRIAWLLRTWTYNSSMRLSKFVWFTGIHLTYNIPHNCIKSLILWINGSLHMTYYVFTISLFFLLILSSKLMKWLISPRYRYNSIDYAK